MDTHEFIQRTRAVIERLTPKIDPQQAQFVREDVNAGEWENALSNLAASLANANTSVSPQDRDELLTLLADLDAPADVANRLTIETQPTAQDPDRP